MKKEAPTRPKQQIYRDGTGFRQNKVSPVTSAENKLRAPKQDSHLYSDLIAQLHETTRAHQFARTAQLILELKNSGRWKELGAFKNWGDFVRRGFRVQGLRRASVWVHLRVARLLLGKISSADLNEIGIEKCRELCVLARRGSLDSNWVARAKIAGVREFRREVRQNIKGMGGPIEFGPYLNPPFRGLIHEPSNEQGVVFLFGMVAQELDFVVKTLRRSCPDCIAERRMPKKQERWAQVRIEFEYWSSNFNHPPAQADLIVCWEDDLKGKAPLPVLELRSEIRKLNPSNVNKSPS